MWCSVSGLFGYSHAIGREDTGETVEPSRHWSRGYLSRYWLRESWTDLTLAPLVERLPDRFNPLIILAERLYEQNRLRNCEVKIVK